MQYFDKFRVVYSYVTNHLFPCSSVLLHNSKFTCYKILKRVFSLLVFCTEVHCLCHHIKCYLLGNCTIISYLSNALLHCTPVTHYPLQETSITGFQKIPKELKSHFQILMWYTFSRRFSGFVVGLANTVSIVGTRLAIFLNKPLFMKMKLFVMDVTPVFSVAY